ncbi:MAG: DoxX family membrane protein [Bacteroidales bacterium]|nr:DoxX family membrane protein [Bacteroidales bacterium]
MKETKIFTTPQLTALVVLRFLIGWHILYEGFSKVLIPNWSSFGFLQESKWIFAGFAQFVLNHATVLHVVDFLNTWGLIAIGLGLIFGLFTRLASISGALLLLLYYLNNPPLIGLEYSVPTEGNYLVVSKTLIESVALVVLALFPTSNVFGLDMFVERFKNLRNNKKE